MYRDMNVATKPAEDATTLTLPRPSEECARVPGDSCLDMSRPCEALGSIRKA